MAVNVTRVLIGCQVVAVALQSSVQYSALLPDDLKPLSATVLSVLQALGCWAQRGYNGAGQSNTDAIRRAVREALAEAERLRNFGYHE